MDNIDLARIHAGLPGLVDQFLASKLDRREFLRTATLLGLSASAAYTIAGMPEPVEQARAAGGTVRISMRIVKIEDPPTYSWVFDANICRQVCDYLTRTGADNVTRPWLLEKWEAKEDMTVWTLTLKHGVKC